MLPTTLNQLVHLLTHVLIFMNNDYVNSETLRLNPNICSTTLNMVLLLDIYIFSTGNFVKISLGSSCNHAIAALASLFVIKTNTRVRNCLIWRVSVIIVCLTIVHSVTAKMLWSKSLGRSSSQLFVTTKWIYTATRSCIIEISIFFFIFREQNFENGLVRVENGQQFLTLLNLLSLRDTQPRVTRYFFHVNDNSDCFEMVDIDTKKMRPQIAIMIGSHFGFWDIRWKVSYL